MCLAATLKRGVVKSAFEFQIQISDGEVSSRCVRGQCGRVVVKSPVSAETRQT